MVRYSINKDFTTINGIQIVHGKIVGNPFAVSYTRTQAVQWIIKNSDFVKNNLNLHLKKSFTKWYSVSDCYDYTLEYFTAKSKVFLENFSEDSEYTLEKYIMGNLKYVVTEYTRLKDSGNMVELSLAPTSWDPDNKVNAGSHMVSEDMIHKSLLNTDNIEQSLIDYPYWDDKFNLVVSNFKVFLRGKKYHSFDVELFVYTLFFDVVFEGQEQFDYVAEVCDIPSELVKLITVDLGGAYKEGLPYVSEIFEGVKDMLEVSKDYVLLRNR